MKLIKQDQYTLPFTLNNLYTLQVNSEYSELPLETVTKISKAVLTTVAATSKSFVQFKIASFLQDIEWQWMSNRGALHKRIGKWLKDKHNFTMPNDLAQAIGNIVREHVVKDQTYYFDFTKDFNWKHGDYGDYDSCFFKPSLGSRTIVKDYFKTDPRIFAIRFYKKKLKTDESNLKYVEGEYGYSGIARAWFAVEQIKNSPTKTAKAEEQLVYFVFNGYGLTTNQIGSIFGTYLNLATNRIGMCNMGSFDGTTYINEAAIAIGPSTIVNKLKNYDLGIVNDVAANRAPKIDNTGAKDSLQLECNVLPGLWSLKQEQNLVTSYLRDLAEQKTKPKGKASLLISLDEDVNLETLRNEMTMTMRPNLPD